MRLRNLSFSMSVIPETSRFAIPNTQGRPRLVAAVFLLTLLKTLRTQLYGSPCAPLLVLWLGEVEGTSLAMTQAKASPVDHMGSHGVRVYEAF